MANRVIARKISTPDGILVLVADDYAKTYFEYTTDPGATAIWDDILGTDEFEDIADEVERDPLGELLLEDNAPISEDRVYIFEDLTSK